MDNQVRAKKVLLHAESELRKLIAEAAQQGDYLAIEKVIGWANALSEMVDDGGSKPSAFGPAIEAASRQNPPASMKTQTVTAKKKSRSKGKHRRYPKFAKSGETLVKIAWSKSQQSEYKHKSPRNVLLLLVDSLNELLSEGTVVSMDSVLPLKDKDGNEIPDYQAYMCLAWLRSIGAVDQKGREGYTRNGVGTDMAAAVNEAWKSLPNDA